MSFASFESKKGRVSSSFKGLILPSCTARVVVTRPRREGADTRVGNTAERDPPNCEWRWGKARGAAGTPFACDALTRVERLGAAETVRIIGVIAPIIRSGLVTEPR